MGEVYRARDTKLGRDVAIKILPAEVAEDPERLARFRREAQVLASLNHPHIAAIYGLEEVEGQPFLVLELVEGEDLSERLQRGPIPLDEALEIAQQVAEGIEEAHAKGVVHRDLKPPNIRVTADGNVKILDFGLAKAYAGETGEGSVSDLSQSPTLAKTGTQAGVILGTAAYMSPEQARGKTVDKRADIWAFGAVLYEMLTGRKIFLGETLSDTIAAILKTEPEWKKLSADVPRPVRRLLRRCLEKNPKSRLHDIADARLEIEDALAGSSEIAVQSTLPSHLPWSLAALFFLSTAALGWLYLGRTATPGRMVSAEISPPPETTFFLDPVFPGVPALSPDGTLLAFTAADSNGARRLYVRSLVEPTTRGLPGTENAAYPFWSPDSRAIGFFADGNLKKVIASSSASEIVCDARNGKGGSWNQEGVIVFAPRPNSPLHRVSPDGGEPTPVTELDVASEQNSHRHPRFLPDGQHFLYFARSQAGTEYNAVFWGSLDGTEPKLLLRSETAASYASGHLLFVRGGTLMAQPFDAGRLALSGEAIPIAENVSSISGTGVALVSVSETGSLIYQTHAGGSYALRLELLDENGVKKLDLGEVTAYTSTNETGSNISPDGRYAVLAIVDLDTGTHDLWIYDLSREIRTRITFDPAEDLAPIWSPDASKVVFTSTRGGGGTFQLYSKDVAGAGDEEQLFESGQIQIPSAFSPDGNLLAVVMTRPTTGQDIWVVPLDGSREPYAFLETRFNESGGFSPDGRFMVVESDESGRNEVYIAPFPGPGRKWQVSIDGGSSPRWRADGRVIFYEEPGGRVVAAEIELRGEEFEIGSVTPLFELSALDSAWWPAPDGQQFLVARSGQQESRPLTLIVNWTEMLKSR